MIRVFSSFALLTLALVSQASAGFELQIGPRGGAPSNTFSFDTGDTLAVTLQMDVFLVENTNTSFTLQNALFNMVRTGGAVPTVSNVARSFGFGGDTSGGSDPTWTFVNFLGSQNSLSSGGLAYVKVGQFDVLPFQAFGPDSTFAFQANNPTAQQFTINGANVSTANQATLFSNSQSFVVSVPEPGMFGLGMVALGVVSLRRRRR